MSVDSVATHARARPNSLACVDLASGRRWSYQQLDRQIDCTAVWLIEQIGASSGARIVAIARNSGWLLVLHLAAVRAGAIFVPLNWRLASPEIQALIEDADPSLLVHDPEFEAPGYTGRGVLSTALEQLDGSNDAYPPRSARRPDNEPATLLYTSGTSGRPKGVVITEANAFWGCTNFIHGNAVTIQSVFLCDMPMFHTAGLFAAVRTPLLAGAAVLISKGFDAKQSLARLADPALRITHYFSVPQMAQRFWQEPEFDPDMLKRLTVYAMGGAPNPAAQIERFVRAGIPMSDGFGMSETGSNFGMPFHDPQLLLKKAGSCGLPYMSLQARIVDQTGKDVEDGEPGELWLQGPSVTPGYWNKPELTAEAFYDGWFKTGDAAIRDRDGFYYLIDRKKDMYISGGENVYPAEVEAVLAELGAIAEVAIIGVPDERWGEAGCAYVKVAPGVTLDAVTVLNHCRLRLAHFKTPTSVVFTDHIPRTASGKVQKHLLKARARQETAT